MEDRSCDKRVPHDGAGSVPSPLGAAPSLTVDPHHRQTVRPLCMDDLTNSREHLSSSVMQRFQGNKEETKGCYSDDGSFHAGQNNLHGAINVKTTGHPCLDLQLKSSSIVSRSDTVSSGEAQSPSKSFVTMSLPSNDNIQRNQRSFSSVKTKNLKRKIDGTDKSTSSQKTSMKPIQPKLESPTKTQSEVEASSILQSPHMLHDVLNQKKRALMRSPEVMSFLQQHQMKKVSTMTSKNTRPRGSS